MNCGNIRRIHDDSTFITADTVDACDDKAQCESIPNRTTTWATIDNNSKQLQYLQIAEVPSASAAAANASIDKNEIDDVDDNGKRQVSNGQWKTFIKTTNATTATTTTTTTLATTANSNHKTTTAQKILPGGYVEISSIG